MQVGDGDCGETIKHGALEIISAIDAGNLNFERPATACAHLANAIGQAVGGTSGALYAILFRAAGRAFWAKGNAEEAATAAHYAEALRLGTEKLQEHGRAQEGDRSMMDALIPAAKAGVAAAEGVMHARISCDNVALLARHVCPFPCNCCVALY
jgi:dihydroxyacetone kinase